MSKESIKAVTDLAVRAGISVAVAATANPIIGGLLALSPEIGATFKVVLGDFVTRSESPRRFNRSFMMTKCVVNGIFERLKDGEQLRDDDFFLKDPDRSPSDELFEAANEASIKQFQEKKIPFIAKMYENGVFSNISVATINSLLIQADERTWRQFVLLSALSGPNTSGIVSRFFRTESDQWFHRDSPHLRADLERLIGRATGLVAEVDSGVALTENGKLFIELAGLDSVPISDIEQLIHVMHPGSVI